MNTGSPTVYDSLRSRINKLETELAEARMQARPEIRTGPDLVNHLNRVIPIEHEATVHLDDDDNMVITLEGVYLEGNDMVPNKHEFEYEFDISVSGTLTVSASNDGEADAIVEYMLRELSYEVNESVARSDYHQRDGVSYANTSYPEHSYQITSHR